MLEAEIEQFNHVIGQKVLSDINFVLLVGSAHVFSIVPRIAFEIDKIDYFVDFVFLYAIRSEKDVGFFVGDWHLDTALALRVLGQVGDVDSGVFGSVQIIFEFNVSVLDLIYL